MRKFIALAALSAVALTASRAMAGGKSSGRKAQERGVAEIPVCAKKLGTIAIVEPDNNWWQGLGLGSPEAVIKMFVMKSGCFSLVDRNKGLAGRNIERALADNGELPGGSNIGRGQVKAADYFIVPDIVSKNERSGGGGLGAALGGFLGGSTLGAIAGNVSVNKKEANILLTLVNSRTTEQERMTEGYARKSDWSFGGGGGLDWFGGGLGVAGGGYQNTDISQVLVLAYLDAYEDMVVQLGGLPANPSAAAPQAARWRRSGREQRNLGDGHLDHREARLVFDLEAFVAEQRASGETVRDQFASAADDLVPSGLDIRKAQAFFVDQTLGSVLKVEEEPWHWHHKRPTCAAVARSKA